MLSENKVYNGYSFVCIIDFGEIREREVSGFLIPSKIRKAIKKDKQLPNVYSPGYVEHDLPAKVYKAADIFLMLSYEETEGLVVLEAIASNIQAIINDKR